MILEAQTLDCFHGVRRGRIDVLSFDLAWELVLELAHGGLDLSADRSARKVVVSDFQRGGFRALCHR